MQLLASWSDFKGRLTGFASLDAERRGQLLFRGHGLSDWPLLPTLDRRVTPFRDDSERAQMRSALLEQFRLEAVRSGLLARHDLPEDALEILARHWSAPRNLIQAL